jgi:signal transduction histidine kinase
MREIPPPPLPARLRPADWIALDAALAACYLTVLAWWSLPRVLHDPGVGPPGLPTWLEWAAVLLVTVPVAIRRRYPLSAFGMAVAGAVLALIGGLRQAPFPSLAYVLYWIALARPRRIAAIALGTALAGVVIAFAGSTSLTSLSPAGSATALPSFLLTALTQIAAWVTGRSLRQRRAYALGLAEQASLRARAEVDAARAAVTEQRLRIARDLHDALAHSVSLMTVQAGAARMLTSGHPEESRALLASIEATGRDCLRDTRRVLGVLRDQDSPLADSTGATQCADEDLPSALGLGDLPRLVARSAAAGVTVTVDAAGAPRDLPAPLGLCAYRVIQEALTNVIRHSRADQCHIALGYGASELSLKVTNPGVGPRTPLAGSPGVGYGLIGMRERILMHEGQFTAGPASDGGFTVAATLPLPDATA